MDKIKALDYVTSLMANQIIDHSNAAKKNPALQENTNSAITKIYNAAEALEIRYNVSQRVRFLLS